MVKIQVSLGSYGCLCISHNQIRKRVLGSGEEEGRG